MISLHLVFVGLNPCFNGRYSQRSIGGYKVTCFMVLILVLMEDTLRGSVGIIYYYGIDSLNPCFNGRYSQSTTRYVVLLPSQ